MGQQPAVRIKPLNPLSFSFLAVLTGLLAGSGAVIFRGLIAFVHNLLFLGKFSVAYEAKVHTAASPWGPLVILAPVIGAVGVAFLVKNFAPEAKGTGVPEVLDAIYYHRGLIRPHIIAIKSLAAALSLPVILVVGLKLGCINHALLSAEAVVHDGCRLMGWVANHVDVDYDTGAESVQYLSRVMQAPLLGEIPYMSDGPDPIRAAAALDLTALT